MFGIRRKGLEELVCVGLKLMSMNCSQKDLLIKCGWRILHAVLLLNSNSRRMASLSGLYLFLSTRCNLLHNQSCRCKRFTHEGEWVGESEGGEEDECRVTKKKYSPRIYVSVHFHSPLHRNPPTPSKRNTLFLFFRSHSPPTFTS